jgi:hypothetical protein
VAEAEAKAMKVVLGRVSVDPISAIPAAAIIPHSGR